MLIRSEPVRAVMTTEVLSVELSASVSQVRELLRTHAFHHVPVVKEGILVGILSTTDLARVSLEAWGVDSDTTDVELDATFSIERIMSHDVVSVQVDEPVVRAVELLADGGFHALPVVDAQRRLVGIVTSTDLLRLLYASL